MAEEDASGDDSLAFYSSASGAAGSDSGWAAVASSDVG